MADTHTPDGRMFVEVTDPRHQFYQEVLGEPDARGRVNPQIEHVRAETIIDEDGAAIQAPVPVEVTITPLLQEALRTTIPGVEPKRTIIRESSPERIKRHLAAAKAAETVVGS